MRLSFVWHFHQPIYRDPETLEYVLPWVNLHSVRNYDQMARLIAETGFPCTVNFVPCLLEQILEYADGRAHDPYQEAIEKDPGALTSRDLELLRKIVGREPEPDGRRLQGKALKALFSPFHKTDLDKGGLLNLRKAILRDLIPSYKRLLETGLLEILSSPYYHPLLPLIFDLHTPKEEVTPGVEFRHPEDGMAQILKGWEYFQTVFGRPPAGLWPSEGGVSGEVAEAAARAGIPFAITDENILWKSLQGPPSRKKLYQSYTCRGLPIFFRDRELSDLLSFTYQCWRAEDAVCHFLGLLDKRRVAAGEEGTCVVVLDGENPWEYYPENAVPFLRLLFSRLGSQGGITLTHLGTSLKAGASGEDIDIVPGTWLGNFSKWVGHPAKNLGWQRLAAARAACGPCEEIYIAEGSDWFWWAGDENRGEFDALFNGYLRKALHRRGRRPT